MWMRRQGRDSPITLEHNVEPGGAKLALDATWDSQICIEKNLLLNIKKIYVQNCTLIYNGKLKLMILYILI